MSKTLNELFGCVLTGEREDALQSLVETYFCSDNDEEFPDTPQGKNSHATIIIHEFH